MTLTKEIQNTVCKAEIQKGNLVAENFTYLFAGELDVITVNKSGYVSELEVKVSRSDFKADSKKNKWVFYEQSLWPERVPNYFFYVCPEGMIKLEELKPYQGLYYYTEGGLTLIKRASLIHRHKHNLITLLTKICRVNNWKHYFGAQQLTIMNREAKANNTESQFKELVKHIHKQT